MISRWCLCPRSALRDHKSAWWVISPASLVIGEKLCPTAGVASTSLIDGVLSHDGRLNAAQLFLHRRHWNTEQPSHADRRYVSPPCRVVAAVAAKAEVKPS